MIEFIVHGKPVPKARPRVVRGHTYTPKPTADYEKLVRQAFVEQKQSMEFGLLKIHIIFFMPIPKSWSNDKKQRAADGILRPDTRPDLDNLYKSITDALNGLAYEDDSQIVTATISKYYSTEPKAFIKIISI